MGGEKGTVCVTGGAGYLASWIIKRLLEHGYSVRTTIQSDPKSKEDVNHITSLPGASEKLKIFEADLGKPDSFSEAINGCIGVFHVAHPTDLSGKTSQEQMIKLSVEGTLGILKSCLDSKTVKRVIYTSSTLAAGLGTSIEDTKEINEQMWSNIDAFISATDNAPGISYAVSKTLTERAAIDFAEEHGLDLVTILPSMIIGPFICPNLPNSVAYALSFVFGNEELLKYLTPTSIVHIDDVASAQIFLLECSEAKGRYICSVGEKSIHEVTTLVQTKYAELKMQTELLKEIEDEQPVHTSSKKLMSMGFKFNYELEESYIETIECCKEKGFLEIKCMDLEVSMLPETKS